jgi:hypothetical protein
VTQAIKNKFTGANTYINRLLNSNDSNVFQINDLGETTITTDGATGTGLIVNTSSQANVAAFQSLSPFVRLFDTDNSTQLYLNVNGGNSTIGGAGLSNLYFTPDGNYPYFHIKASSTMRALFDESTTNHGFEIRNEDATNANAVRMYQGYPGNHDSDLVINIEGSIASVLSPNGLYIGEGDAVEKLEVDGNCVIDGVIYLNTAKTLGIFTGTGSPEGAITAAVGSTFHRTDGGAGTSYYVKESGTGNTGWIAK